MERQGPWAGEEEQWRKDRPDDRDAELMGIIRLEHLDSFSFDGLRRRSGLHQETLSRILDRLEERGLLTKGAHGYSVKRSSGSEVAVMGSPRVASVPLLQTLIPEDLGLRDIVSALQGRWFGSLRWLGMSLDGESTVLKWISEDGGIQVDAEFSPGQLEVTANINEGWKLVDAVKASYELMGHLTRVYSKLSSRGRVALLSFWDIPRLVN